MKTGGKHFYENMRQFYRDQVQWVKDCGGDLAGYIAKYHGKYGRSIENATAIYEADTAELKRLSRYA